MHYGLGLPTGGECGDPTFLVELAVLAEAAGWDGVFLEDYICFQGDATAPTCDPWVALAGIAVRTERVRLGTMVTPLSRRRPWKVARGSPRSTSRPSRCSDLECPSGSGAATPSRGRPSAL